MTTIIIEGTKKNGKKFRKEVEEGIKELDLSDQQLAEVDLSPLESCLNLQTITLDFSTTIRWESNLININKLPKGLQKYWKEIQKAHEEYRKNPQRKQQQEVFQLVKQG